MAAQSMGTKGPEARGESSWMARATSSLPVPLSPSRRMVALEAAAWRTVSMAERKAGELPTRPPTLESWATFSRSRRFSSRRRYFSSAFLTVRTSWCRRSGLVRKSSAPSFMASTAASTVPYAVISTTSTCGAMALAARSRATPDMPGIIRSVTTTRISSLRRVSRAFSPEGAERTRRPSRSRMRRTDSRWPGSSSTTSTVSRSSAAAVLIRSPSEAREEPPLLAFPDEDDAIDVDELPPFRRAREGELVAVVEAVFHRDAIAVELMELADVDAQPLVRDPGEALLELLPKPPLVVVVRRIARGARILEEVLAGQVEDALDVAILDRAAVLLDHQEDGPVLLGVLDLGVADVAGGAADRRHEHGERRRERSNGWMRRGKSLRDKSQRLSCPEMSGHVNLFLARTPKCRPPAGRRFGLL